jgi:hypothetical protein
MNIFDSMAFLVNFIIIIFGGMTERFIDLDLEVGENLED